jgi:hypothetical protein
MTVQTRLLTRTDIKRLLRAGRSMYTVEPGPMEEIGICPIVELLELCESIKKGRLRSDMASFKSGMQVLDEGPVRCGEVAIIVLDRERLANSLFERDQHIVIGLWPPAANRRVLLTHSVRRLLLRPSEQTWWDGDIYAEAEVIYGNVEGWDTNA